MVLPLWRSLHSLNLMLPKEDRKAMLLRLYNEDTPLMDHSKDRFHNNNNNSKPQSDADTKDELDDIKHEDGIKHEDAIKNEDSIKDEDKVDADVEYELANNEENGEGNVEIAGLGKNGDREDEVLPSSLKEEVEDGM